jgi:hypothetical protein
MDGMLRSEYMSAEEWRGGRAPTRSTPMPISQSPTGGNQSRMFVPRSVRETAWPHGGDFAYEMDIDQEDRGDDLEDEFYESEMELEGLDWKLEMDEPSDRPSNPVARQIEGLMRPKIPTAHQKDLPISKRQRYGSGSIDSSVDGQVGSEGTRQWTDGTPPERSPLSLRTPSDKRSNFASPPPSPCLGPQNMRQQLPAILGSSPSSPHVAVARYYTGGPVGRIETPKTPSRSDSLGGSRGQPSPTVPGWRGSSSGTTPPSIFYVKPAELPRGGGVSPLREVIRNLGIS